MMVGVDVDDDVDVDVGKAVVVWVVGARWKEVIIISNMCFGVDGHRPLFVIGFCVPGGP